MAEGENGICRGVGTKQVATHFWVRNNFMSGLQTLMINNEKI